jgi:ATPase subunit of ABC transporter with duplicated ATPase domains
MSTLHPPHLTADALGLILPDGRRIFGGLSLSLESVPTGLVGANGVGKSLLLDVLAGVRPPSAGRVVRQGRIAYVPQGRARRLSRPGETVADRLGVTPRLAALARVEGGSAEAADFEAVGADGWDLPARTEAALARVGLGHLALDRPVAGLSGGEASRVTLVAALLEAPDALLLDEPTNDLDARSRRALLDLLGGWRGGLLIVSHDREVLRRVGRILEMGPRGVREYGGDYDAYRAARDGEAAAAEAELASAEAARRRALEETRRARERQERRSARGRRARAEGGVPKIQLNAWREGAAGTSARLRRVQEGVLDQAAERVAEAKARVEEIAALRVDVPSAELPAGKDVLVVENVSWAPPGAAAPLLGGVNLVLRGPERVAVAGPNGSGKTTLLRLVLGELVPDAGVVRVGLPAERVAYMDQRAARLPDGATVLEAFRAAHPAWDEGHARHVLARFLFPGDSALVSVDALSGGERVRAALACVLGGPSAPGLLVLDEPTNHLDLLSLYTVERAVAAYDGALLVVSHDGDFLKAVGVQRTLRLG